MGIQNQHEFFASTTSLTFTSVYFLLAPFHIKSWLVYTECDSYARRKKKFAIKTYTQDNRCLGARNCSFLCNLVPPILDREAAQEQEDFVMTNLLALIIWIS
jgi:hypothetical protein